MKQVGWTLMLGTHLEIRFVLIGVIYANDRKF